MACCDFSRLNLDKDCAALAVGGLIKDIYFANLCDIDTITSSTNDNVYDDIQMLTDPVTTQPYTWYRIQFKELTGAAAFTLNVGNNRNVTHRVNATMQGVSAAQYASLEKMMGGGEGVFIAVDSTGQAHLLGRTRGLLLATAEGGTGLAEDDLVGAELVFERAQTHMVEFIAPNTTITVDDSNGGTISVVF